MNVFEKIHVFIEIYEINRSAIQQIELYIEAKENCLQRYILFEEFFSSTLIRLRKKLIFSTRLAYIFLFIVVRIR